MLSQEVDNGAYSKVDNGAYFRGSCVKNIGLLSCIVVP